MPFKILVKVLKNFILIYIMLAVSIGQLQIIFLF